MPESKSPAHNVGVRMWLSCRISNIFLDHYHSLSRALIEAIVFSQQPFNYHITAMTAEIWKEIWIQARSSVCLQALARALQAD